MFQIEKKTGADGQTSIWQQGVPFLGRAILSLFQKSSEVLRGIRQHPDQGRFRKDSTSRIKASSA